MTARNELGKAASLYDLTGMLVRGAGRLTARSSDPAFELFASGHVRPVPAKQRFEESWVLDVTASPDARSRHARLIGEMSGPGTVPVFQDRTLEIENARLRFEVAALSKELERRATSGPSLQPTFDRLGELAALEPNWDSYGAISPTALAIARASGFAAAVVEHLGSVAGNRTEPYFIAPIADGGVNLEWHGASSVIEINIGPDGAISYLLIDRGGTERRFEEGDDLPQQRALEFIRRVVLG